MASRFLNFAIPALGLAVLASVATFKSTAIALTPISPPPLPTATAEGYSRYTLSGQYSIDFLSGAYLTQNSSGYLMISNYFPETGRCCFEPGEVKTDAYTLEESFEDAAAAIATDMGGLAGEFVRQERFFINGRRAARSWWTNGDNGADSALTVVQVSDTQTARINSFYSLGDNITVETIESIHSSFRVLNR